MVLLLLQVLKSLQVRRNSVVKQLFRKPGSDDFLGGGQEEAKPDASGPDQES